MAVQYRVDRSNSGRINVEARRAYAGSRLKLIDDLGKVPPDTPAFQP